jgi:pimeloyl-ACP methyl ester carboxylesterase
LPILLVRGGLRSPLGPEHRDEFARISAHAAIRIVENAGHLVAREAPVELAKLIAEFVDRLEARSDTKSADCLLHPADCPPPRGKR